METYTYNVRWQVSLSNGETFFEGKGDYEDIQDGRLSPWQRLLNHMDDTGAVITSMSLYSDSGQTWNLPSAGRNPKFKEFANLPQPYDFVFDRKSSLESSSESAFKDTKKDEEYAVISAYYGINLNGTPALNLKIQYWVDENNPKNCWIVPIIQ